MINAASKNGTVNGEAIGRLARCYRDGRGTVKDLDMAAKLMRRAAKKDVPWAEAELNAIESSRKG